MEELVRDYVAQIYIFFIDASGNVQQEMSSSEELNSTHEIFKNVVSLPHNLYCVM